MIYRKKVSLSIALPFYYAKSALSYIFIDKNADTAKSTDPSKTVLPLIKYGEVVERKSNLRFSILKSSGTIIGEVKMITKKANFVFSYPSLYCTGKYKLIKMDVTKNISANSFMSAVPNCGISKVSTS